MFGLDQDIPAKSPWRLTLPFLPESDSCGRWHQGPVAMDLNVCLPSKVHTWNPSAQVDDMRNLGLWEMTRSWESSSHVERPRGACLSHLLYENKVRWCHYGPGGDWARNILRTSSLQICERWGQLYICLNVYGVIYNSPDEPRQLQSPGCWLEDVDYPEGLRKATELKWGLSVPRNVWWKKVKCWGKQILAGNLLAGEKTSVTAMMKFDCKS